VESFRASPPLSGALLCFGNAHYVAGAAAIIAVTAGFVAGTVLPPLSLSLSMTTYIHHNSLIFSQLYVQ